jgi:hypothetical protein
MAQRIGDSLEMPRVCERVDAYHALALSQQVANESRPDKAGASVTKVSVMGSDSWW